MTTTSEPELRDRAARNQDRFRKYNERIEPHNRTHTWVDPPMPDWICECAIVECVVPVRLTFAEYESVRADPTHFLVAPGDDHVIADVERVAARHERYWVVVGDAGDMSEALDRRAHDSVEADQASWNVAAPRL